MKEPEGLFSRAMKGSDYLSSWASNQWYLDPSPWYKHMRETSPILYDPGAQTFHLFRYADCDRALTLFRTFSNKFVEGNEGGEPEDIIPMRSLLGRDPPSHTKLRKLVSASFNPTTIAALEPKVREVADSLLKGVSPEKTFNLVSGFAVPFPAMVIAGMLGVESQDWKEFKAWSDNETGQSEITSLEERREVHLRFVRYFEKTVEERRAHPGEDLVSSIIMSEVDGERLSLPDILSFCMLLLVGGIETTTNLIGSGIRLFIKHRSFDRLRERPDLIPSAVEEALRYTSPVRMMGRHAIEDTSIGGVGIKSGQGVMSWLGSANRDETKFSSPEVFDIERNPNPHIAFGHGIHMCIGAPLARLEAKVAFEVLLHNFASAELAVPEGSIEAIRNVNVCGVKELPVIFSSAR